MGLKEGYFTLKLDIFSLKILESLRLLRVLADLLVYLLHGFELALHLGHHLRLFSALLLQFSVLLPHLGHAVQYLPALGLLGLPEALNFLYHIGGLVGLAAHDVPQLLVLLEQFLMF